MPFPIIHELVTASQSVAALVTGNTKKAGKVWVDYSEESVLGAPIASGVHLIAGNNKKAKECIKGAGRATGHALVGGGLLPEEIPVFKEINKAGKALGDTMTGDIAQARKRFTEELHEEYTDPKFAQNMGLAVISATVGTAATFATAGLAGPAFIAANSAVSTATGVAVNAADQGIDIAAGRKNSFDTTGMVQDGVTSGLTGGVMATLVVPNSEQAAATATTKTLANKGASGFGREAGRQLTGLTKPKDLKMHTYMMKGTNKAVNEGVKEGVKPRNTFVTFATCDVPVGFQTDGSGKYWCAVANTQWGTIPAKAKDGNCWYPYGHKERETKSFFLVKGFLLPKGVIPKVAAHGIQIDGSGKYWCAVANTQWGTIPGKAKNGNCWYSYGGKEHTTNDFRYVDHV